MVGTTLSLVFTGGLALLAGGGGHALTKSHYQRKIRELEARLHETQRRLAEREAQLAAAQAEIAHLRGRLEERERRLTELAASIAALRDLAIDLRRRLIAHDSFTRRALAAITLHGAEHRVRGEEMAAHLIQTQRALESFNGEETALQVQLIDMRHALRARAAVLESLEDDVRRCRADEETCATELRAAIGA